MCTNECTHTQKHTRSGEGVDKCTVLIAVITDKYIESTYCKNELYFAERLKKKLLPVVYGNVNFKASTKAKGVEYAISSIHQCRVQPEKHNNDAVLKKILEGMEKVLGKWVGREE